LAESGVYLTGPAMRRLALPHFSLLVASFELCAKDCPEDFQQSQ
jgi:hypothetical protein